MNGFMLALLVLILHQEVRTASIPIEETQENIKFNLIDYENDLIEGLSPPLPQAVEHFSPGRKEPVPETPFIVEISRKYLKFETAGFPPQRVKLLQNETEGIQQLSLRFAEFLNSSKLSSNPENQTEDINWRDINPILTLSKSGISLQFSNSEEETDSGNDEVESTNRVVLWDFLTRYATNIFEAKVKELKVEEQFADVIDNMTGEENTTGFDKFEKVLWEIMKLSVNYAETVFQGWTASTETPTTTTTTTTEEEEEEAYLAGQFEKGAEEENSEVEDSGDENQEEGGEGNTTFEETDGAIFQYDDHFPIQIFPSGEFNHRSKDVSLIFYGRGII